MFDKLKKYLNKPFPMLETTREKIGIAFYFGFFVFLFLLIFQPFGLGEYTDTIVRVTAGFGLITFLSVIITTFGLRLLKSDITSPDTWSIKHHLILSFVNLTVIALGNWAYSSMFLSGKIHPHTLFSYLFITLAVGIFPVILSVYYYDNRLTNKNRHLANETTGIIRARKQQHENKVNHFESSVKSESFSVLSSNIICIKAEGNYCSFYFLEKDVLQKKLLRIPLKSVENELETAPGIMRCHRSWLVNPEKVQSVSGTARSISLTMEYCDFKVPVSRNYANMVTSVLRHI